MDEEWKGFVEAKECGTVKQKEGAHDENAKVNYENGWIYARNLKWEK